MSDVDTMDADGTGMCSVSRGQSIKSGFGKCIDQTEKKVFNRREQ